MRLKFVILICATALFAFGSGLSFGQDTPALTLEKSIPIAQDALMKANFNIANHYIFSIIFTNSSKGRFWYYTYRPYNPSQYQEFFIKVYMDGTCDLSQAKAPRGR